MTVSSLQSIGQNWKANTTGCQQRSTSGRSYVGKANTTTDGIPCQKWSDSHPHDHGFTYLGDHNFCRNPDGDSGVWCFTTDPEEPYQKCPVPYCAPLKALDFSLDNDGKSDENNSHTHASLEMENFPSSFTLCTAFIIESWNQWVAAKLFELQDDNGKTWSWLRIYAAVSNTQFSLQLDGSPKFVAQSRAA